MAEYGIVGDSEVNDFPQMGISEEDLAPEKNAAKFSKTKEFQVFKEHMESRILFYQTQLPGGKTVAEGTSQERADNWAVATAIIGEFQAVLRAYEQAQEAVREDAARRAKTV